MRPAFHATQARPSLRMPASQRDLFDLLGVQSAEVSVDDLLGRLDMSDVSSRHIPYVAHRRLPDSLESVIAAQQHDFQSQLAAALHSEEFASNLVLNLMNAYPEVRREIVLRLPATAPSALLHHLRSVRPVLSDRLGLPVSASAGALLAKLAPLVRELPFQDEFVVDGGFDMERCVARAEPRPQDHICVVLDAMDAAFVAQANAVVAALLDDRDVKSPASVALLRRMELRHVPATEGELTRLAGLVLADPLLCPPNPICTRLSHVERKTAADALFSMAALDMEITTTAAEPTWLLERFGVLPPPLAASPAFLSVDQARRMFPELLQKATEEDRIVTETVNWALRATGRPSIRGGALAELAGNQLGLQPPSERDEKPAADLIVAIGDQATALHRDTMASLRASGAMVGQWIGFGRDGGSEAVKQFGWSVTEADSTWTNGASATIVLPRPDTAADHLFEIDASPFVAGQALPHQRLGLRINGHAVAILAVSQRCIIATTLPWPMLDDHPDVTIELFLPDAARPRDFGAADDDRRLSLYVRSIALVREVEPEATEAPAMIAALTELSLAELAIQFESIGENCEFGLIQRRWGAEPLGLLRFASSPLDKLLPALRNRLRGMGDPGMLEVQEGGGREYMVLDRTYRFLYHAWAKIGELTPEQILTREYRRVPFLIRKLTEELQAGEKLFVYHGMQPLAAPQVRALSSALRLYGPGTLLWMELADADHPPGSVERVDARVIKGYVDRFAPGENAHDISLACWEDVCRAAWRLWRSGAEAKKAA